MKCIIHQYLVQAGLEGMKPPKTIWYKCKACGQQVLVKVILELPQVQEERIARQSGIKIRKTFVAKDGSSYPDLMQAAERNTILEEVMDIEQFLVPRSDALESGEGFIQQDKDTVEEVRARFTKLACDVLEKGASEVHAMLAEHFDEFEDPKNLHPLYRIYRRLRCIDSDYREWQTSLLAEAPQDGKQLRLNLGPEPPQRFLEGESNE